MYTKMEKFLDKIEKADKISLVCMIFVAACVFISGHGSIIGSLCIGAIFCNGSNWLILFVL